MADFTSLVARLGGLRNTLTETLRNKSIDAATTDSLATLIGKAALIDSTSGLNEVRNGYQLFRGNTTLLRFPEFDTSGFDSMYQICDGCSALEYVPALDTSQVTNMMYAFRDCVNLEEIGTLDTSKITSATSLFHGCTKLRKIASVDFSSVTAQINTAFTSCAALVDIRFEGIIKVDIAMSGCPNLSVESLLSLLNALSAVVSGKTCNIGSKNLGKLTAAQRAIATNKGWTLG